MLHITTALFIMRSRCRDNMERRDETRKNFDTMTTNSPVAIIDVVCAICTATVPETLLESHVKNHVSLENLSGVPSFSKVMKHFFSSRLVLLN